MIDMGASGVLFKNRTHSVCRVDETRQYTIRNSNCWGVAEAAINEGRYLIFNPCIDNNGTVDNQSDNAWKLRINHIVTTLKSLGATKSNTRLTIINEPMKFISRERYVQLINMAYAVVNKEFYVGAGNEEFLKAQAEGDMYPYILNHATFDILDIHIQGSCLNESDASYWTNVAQNWAISHNKPLDCTEANYSDVAKSSGYNRLLMQLKYAEQIGCKHFPMVFIGLSNEDKYKWLSFIYNGAIRSSYWTDYKRIIKEKAYPIIPEKEVDMELERYYYKGKKNFPNDPKIYGGKFLRLCFKLSPNASTILDADFDTAVRNYQTSNNLIIDGIVGPQTFNEIFKSLDNHKFYSLTHSYWARKIVNFYE